jgi:uncharacterized protein (DUF2062 family)
VLTNIRHRLDRLASSELDPGRTAAAIALGVFLSFSPFLGLQILLGLGAAFAFRLSRVAVLIGLCANLPWIMLPWYMLTTALAATAMGHTGAMDLDVGLREWLSLPMYHRSFWDRTGTIASTLFWPFLLGPTLAAVVPSAAAYVLSLRLLTRRRRAATAGSTLLPGDAEQRASDRHVHDAERARLEP